jgi:hypothetical protein
VIGTNDDGPVDPAADAVKDAPPANNTATTAPADQAQMTIRQRQAWHRAIPLRPRERR